MVDVNTRYCFVSKDPSYFVYSDASATGGGAIIDFNNDFVCHKMWSENERVQSSTWRELSVIEFSLQSFASVLGGSHKDVLFCSFSIYVLFLSFQVILSSNSWKGFQQFSSIDVYEVLEVMLKSMADTTTKGYVRVIRKFLEWSKSRHFIKIIVSFKRREWCVDS